MWANIIIVSLTDKISFFHLNILLLLGLALFGGTIGGRLFQKLRIPQVVGYIIIGILAGQSGFNIINRDIIQTLQPFNYFALGLIGFMIGGELKRDVLQRYGRQFLIILFSEGFTAFAFVTLSIGILGTLLGGNPLYYWALGLLLGAIASATAPAATTEVLWEYKTKGPLTSTVLGIVALDDALSLVLFAIASRITGRLLGQSDEGIFYTFVHPLYEIGGAVAVGFLAGMALTMMLKKYAEKERMLAFSLGSVLFVLGFSLAVKVDMLLAAMTLGFVVVNRVPRISKEVFSLVSAFAAPIYVLFFVMVGSKLNTGHMNIIIILLTLIYLIGRTAGKMSGAILGAKIAHAPQTVRKYLPFCLFSQAGVAIGLSIVAYHAFPGEIGSSIVIVITASTFVVQLLGPPSVKYAATKAGEVGLDITEEDLIKKTYAYQVMDNNPPLVFEDTPLRDILDTFSNSSYYCYPVISRDGKLKGIITVESIRQTFRHSELATLFLAHDIMESVAKTITPDTPLAEVQEIISRYNLDYLPVVDDNMQVKGIIERRMVVKFISTRMIELEQRAAYLANSG